MTFYHHNLFIVESEISVPRLKKFLKEFQENGTKGHKGTMQKQIYKENITLVTQIQNFTLSPLVFCPSCQSCFSFS